MKSKPRPHVPNDPSVGHDRSTPLQGHAADAGNSLSASSGSSLAGSRESHHRSAKMGLRRKVASYIGRSGKQIKRLDQIDAVVLYSRPIATGAWSEHELLADRETEEVAQFVAQSLRPHCRSLEVRGCSWDLLDCLGQLDPDQYLIFNLYEGQIGHPGSEAKTARLIDALGLTYTGADHNAISLSNNKWLTKKRLSRAALPTPPCQLVRQFAQWKLKLPAPLIVKPVEEDGSIGITQTAIVHSQEEAYRRVKELQKKFKQSVLIEEFIIGREINVAMWGNRTPEILPLAEIDFTWTQDPLEKIVSYASKWIEGSPEFSGTPGICPADLTKREQLAIEKVSTKCWQNLGLNGYARIDIRLREGIPYILEVNANPDLHPDAGFFRSVAAAGYSYEEMILYIANLALSDSR